jgi:hypothetical protein
MRHARHCAVTARHAALVGVVELFSNGHAGRRSILRRDAKLVQNRGERLASLGHIGKRRTRRLMDRRQGD